MSKICLPIDAGKMTKTQTALEVARHTLIAMHGLNAFDGTAPQEIFEIDTSGAVKLLYEALSEFSGSEKHL